MSSQAIPRLQGESSSKISRPKTSMCWTEEHDKRLLGEIALIDPFTGTKKGTVQRGKKWDEIAENLCQLQDIIFKVDKRGVRDRYSLLAQRYRKKMKEEEKESGVSPEMTEIEMGLESIIEVEDAAEEDIQSQVATKREKADEEKKSAEQVRRKAMEKLGETQKRKADGDDEGKKRKRGSTANDSIHYLKEKNEQLSKFKEEEMELRKKELELETRKQDTLMQVFLKQQEQQQKQFQEFQSMMMTMFTKFSQK